jgi:TnpA family transposase
MPSLKILISTELKIFKNPPEFNSEERKKYFYIPVWAEKEFKTFRTVINKVGFILQLGYFQAVKRFFTANKYPKKDIEYIANKLNTSFEEIDINKYKGATFNRNKKIILINLGFEAFTQKHNDLLMEKANQLVSKQLKPKFIFSELIDFLIKNNIEVPEYYIFAQIITKGINNYEQKILSILKINLTNEHKNLLNKVLGFDMVDQPNSKLPRYNLTFLKKVNHSLKPKAINENVESLKVIEKLFCGIKEVIDILDLPSGIIEYYANYISQSDIFNLLRKEESKRYLYLISFIVNHYYELHDHLTEVLLKVVQHTRNASIREYKEYFFEERKQKAKEEYEVINSYDYFSKTYFEIKDIIDDDNLIDDVKLNKIKLIYSNNKEQTVTLDLKTIKQTISKTFKEELYFNILASKSRKLHNRLDNMIRNLQFNEKSSDKKIIEAIQCYKNDTLSLSPIDLLEDEQQEACFDDEGEFKKTLYKVFLFFKIADDIKSGSLNLKYSYKYRSFDDYLIPKEIWNEKRQDYIKKAELEDFTNIQVLIKNLADTLNAGYYKTNRNIMNKTNQYSHFDKNNKLRINTPSVDKEEMKESISDLFTKENYVSLSEILATVNKYSYFLDAFQHYSIKYNKVKPFARTFFAAIIGYGCNIGKTKIGRISKHINENELENTINWYFTEDNVDAANDRILKLQDKLLLPNKLKENKDIIHTSSDGQKYSVHKDSIHANYSFKYFGKGKGVSAYNFIDDRHFLFHSTVISSSDREAAYVIDGLLHNNIVQSDIHSTDTHGYTELIFAVTYLLGFSFAPRIKNPKKQTLYSFINRKIYQEEGFQLLPERYINIEIIQEHWDDILRLIATIKLKETTASQLFKRLSSYSKKHPLYTAIKAFGQIIKTIFLLVYIDDVQFRQSIGKQLNISELTNKFSKAIAYANNQELDYATKEEQILAEGCKRLIKNSIICWNYLYLSQLLADSDDHEKKKLLNIMKNGSIQTWKHINLQGEFDFSEEKLEDSIGFKFPKILALSLP